MEIIIFIIVLIIGLFLLAMIIQVITAIAEVIKALYLLVFELYQDISQFIYKNRYLLTQSLLSIIGFSMIFGIGILIFNGQSEVENNQVSITAIPAAKRIIASEIPPAPAVEEASTSNPEIEEANSPCEVIRDLLKSYIEHKNSKSFESLHSYYAENLKHPHTRKNISRENFIQKELEEADRYEKYSYVVDWETLQLRQVNLECEATFENKLLIKNKSQKGVLIIGESSIDLISTFKFDMRNKIYYIYSSEN